MSKWLVMLAVAVGFGVPVRAQQTEMDSELSLPPLAERGTIASSPCFYHAWSGADLWQLHPGLNASLSAAAIYNKRLGTGFGNSLSLVHANLITPRLSYAIGVYTSHLDWGGFRVNDAGLSAMLDYRFDEHWEASVFLQKSFVQPKLPPQLLWATDVGDKIGASVSYHFNPAFSVSLSVWEERRPSPFMPGMPPVHY